MGEARFYEVTCETCGNRWRIEAVVEPEQLECIGCGADTFAITEVGRTVR